MSMSMAVSKSFLECTKTIRRKIDKIDSIDKVKTALDSWIKEKEFVFNYEQEYYEKGKKFDEIITEIYRDYVRNK